MDEGGKVQQAAATAVGTRAEVGTGIERSTIQRQFINTLGLVAPSGANGEIDMPSARAGSCYRSEPECRDKASSRARATAQSARKLWHEPERRRPFYVRRCGASIFISFERRLAWKRNSRTVDFINL